MSQLNVKNLSNENEDGAPEIANISDFSATSYMCPPKGTTAQRPTNPQPGDIRFNTDTASLEYYRGNTIGWTQIEMTSPDLDGGARGIFFGGYQAPAGRMNVINYLTIPTLGNTLDFGDLNDHTGRSSAAASRTRAVCLGGFQSPALVNIIQYVTIASLGNATDFGDLTYARNQAGAASSQIRAIGGGGNPITNAMDYITIAATGNAVDYGDLTVARQSPNAAASSTRMIFMAGEVSPGTTNVADYVTIATTGNASDFGDCATAVRLSSACSNSTRAIKAGGDFNPSSDTVTNVIEFFTIATTDNAIDFGDLTVARTELTSCSSPTRGIFAGGSNPAPTLYNTIDYVDILTMGNAVDFGDFNPATAFRPGGTSNAHGGL
jgi:hypothetical protein